MASDLDTSADSATGRTIEASDVGLLPGTQRELSRWMSDRQATFRVPSLVAGLWRGSELVFLQARGTIDGSARGPVPNDRTQYRIGSITKSFVAAGVLTLCADGDLDLADPIGEHLPELGQYRVTIAELLSQSAGISAESPGSWWERSPGRQWESLVADLTPAHQVLEPGAYFHYSNLGFAFLGRLIEAKRTGSWFEYIRATFLEPLGMADTSYLPMTSGTTVAPGLAVHPWLDLVHAEPSHDGGAMAPAGQIWSTVADLGVWGQFLAGHTQGILAPETVAGMHKVRSVDDGDSWSSGYGLGLQISRHEGRRIWGHSGSMPGFVAGLWVDEKEDLTAVFLCNSTAGPGPGFVTELFDTVVSAEPRVSRPWSATAVNPEMFDLVGTWFWGVAQFTLAIEGSETIVLKPVSGTGRAASFNQDATGKWIGDSGYYFGEELLPVRDSSGAVNHLNLNTFILTRTPYDPSAPIPGGLDERGWYNPDRLT